MYKKKRKKYLRSSHLDGKRKITYFHAETANAKNGGENRGHVVIFDVRVSRIRDAKSLLIAKRRPSWIFWISF